MIFAGINIPDTYLIWGGFLAFVCCMLAIDLGIFNRKSHKVSVKEALIWTGFWISLALTFNFIIYIWQGGKPALEFLTGYILEKSLSVDNLFVFLIILTYFSVSQKYWHKVLFYGILGALILRGIFIGVGVAVISRYHWVLYIFGVILIYTAIKVAMKENEKVDPERNPVLRFFRKILPLTKDYEEGHFFVRKAGRLFATPLLIVLIAIETTDIVFAMDSVPAIFGVTLNPFIIFTSNVFAILGLRALFFAIAGVMEGMYYLNYGLSVVLGFIGAKILLEIEALPYGLTNPIHYVMPVWMALVFVGIVLSIAIAASYIHATRAHGRRPLEDEIDLNSDNGIIKKSDQLVKQDRPVNKNLKNKDKEHNKNNPASSDTKPETKRLGKNGME